MEYLLDRIKELIDPILQSKQVDLVELKLGRQKGRLHLRFFVDKPEGGIMLSECADLNVELGKILDEAGLIQEGLVLDVSSPGLDRPLTTVKDFKRVINRDIKVFLSEAIEERKEFQGKLVSVEEDRIIISFENRFVTIPLDKINKAKQAI
ncbi:MAG: ribosome maturation factor RimP [Candidatus Omnitrophota bacterium]|nr:ribosome maturation factor RimP [Candidatus Omnitrophota bacterium]